LPGYDPRDAANASARIIFPNQGRSVTIGKSTYTFKVIGEDTYGKFGLLELRMQDGYGIKPHTHHELLEMFYVVVGDVAFLVGSGEKLLPRGSIATIPRK
jgi:mannose-6-phosphate isomerase-like protein (cupin superfamily)